MIDDPRRKRTQKLKKDQKVIWFTCSSFSALVCNFAGELVGLDMTGTLLVPTAIFGRKKNKTKKKKWLFRSVVVVVYILSSVIDERQKNIRKSEKHTRIHSEKEENSLFFFSWLLVSREREKLY